MHPLDKMTLDKLSRALRAEAEQWDAVGRQSPELRRLADASRERANLQLELLEAEARSRRAGSF